MLATMPERKGARGGGAAKGFTVERAPADAPGRRALAGRIVDHLARREVVNNLAVGIASALADGSLRRDDAELLLAIDPAGRSAAALVMTPPYRLVVGDGDDPAALETLLEDLLRRGARPPGVVGPEPTAGRVASWLADRLGLEARRKMRQGIYGLERVREAARTPGEVRPATEADEGVVVPWLTAFFAEAHVDVGTPEETFRGFLTSEYRRLYVLEADGRPVSIAGLGARTPHGRRIGPVYTPPELRRRGYAESLVAAVSRSVLDAGNRYCFLYTDLDNPTSNAVYVRIGYEMAAEASEYDLARPGA